jgi:hypothetical protein
MGNGIVWSRGPVRLALAVLATATLGITPASRAVDGMNGGVRDQGEVGWRNLAEEAISGGTPSAADQLRTDPVRHAVPGPVACQGCWHPAPGTSWQWQLSGKVDRSFDVVMYDIDLFDNGRNVVQALHNEGRVVICYISAGSWERWRPDAGRFPKSVLGRKLGGWAGERWLDIRRVDLLSPILRARMDMCKRRGYDGVEFDNVDGYTNKTGFPLTARHQLRFNVWLANQAHRRGLSVGLKNDLAQVPKLLPYFDWALVEQCFQYDECSLLTPFIQAGKAVFEVEYELAPETFCPQANQLNFDALRKRYSLDPWRIACR